ncbi:PREDICTED: uncharacterized protein LOC109486470 [Branchiostoma belcheri]|uniref:Uncharacterized protein LOC109486470 n=1 Tax=Branchiostoma belcheri TaxID=7741 RepID=A0A6P5AHR2_BRABE|nr:PREDICTED: uncharacterized protein LOC109486470 [Branchiostoma belcheri]
MASDTHLLFLFLYLTMLTPSLQQQCPSACRHKPDRGGTPGDGQHNVGYTPDPDGQEVHIGIGEDEPGPQRPNMEDNVVTERQLRALATKLGAEWEQLSTELGFSHGELYQFKEDNPRNVRQAIFVMLATWRENRGQEATIGRLVQHMRNVNIDEEIYGVLLRDPD